MPDLLSSEEGATSHSDTLHSPKLYTNITIALSNFWHTKTGPQLLYRESKQSPFP